MPPKYIKKFKKRSIMILHFMLKLWHKISSEKETKVSSDLYPIFARSDINIERVFTFVEIDV